MVQRVIALDAFARCWVQEGVLLKEVAKVLPEDKGRAFGRLHRAWQTQRRASSTPRWRYSPTSWCVPHSTTSGSRAMACAVGCARSGRHSAWRASARIRRGSRRCATLAQRLDDDIRNTTNELIRLHGLEGEAGMTVLKRLADHYATSTHLSEGRAAVFGGLLTGALAGLKADVVTGGLTLGGGMIAGGVLGALGAAGLARGYNMVRGIDAVTVSWTDEIMNRLLAGALLTYLAVAHYGRGRGEWAQSEHPAFWETVVTEVLAQQGTRFQDFWRRRQAGTDADLRAAVQHELTLAAERVLIRLYPEAVDAAAIGTSTARISAEARADAAKARAADPGAAIRGRRGSGCCGFGRGGCGRGGCGAGGGCRVRSRYRPAAPSGLSGRR